MYALVIASIVKLFKGTKAFFKSKEDRARSTYFGLFILGNMHVIDYCSQISLQY